MEGLFEGNPLDVDPTSLPSDPAASGSDPRVANLLVAPSPHVGGAVAVTDVDVKKDLAKLKTAARQRNYRERQTDTIATLRGEVEAHKTRIAELEAEKASHLQTCAPSQLSQWPLHALPAS